MTKAIILGGGCFWCLEAVFNEVQGVLAVEPGYIGGEEANPSYEAVCQGGTGHTEAVRIRFDSQEISLEELLEIFFATHDPTQLNRQGNDVGTQYRSAVFWLDEAQRDVTLALITKLQTEQVFTRPIVTEVLPAKDFYPAEAYHYRYYERHPSQSYCAVVIAPTLDKFRKIFARVRKVAD